MKLGRVLFVACVLVAAVGVTRDPIANASVESVTYVFDDGQGGQMNVGPVPYTTEPCEYFTCWGNTRDWNGSSGYCDPGAPGLIDEKPNVNGCSKKQRFPGKASAVSPFEGRYSTVEILDERRH